MKKALSLFMVLALFAPLTFTHAEPPEQPEQTVTISFVVEVDGSGYSIPAKTNFILGKKVVLWYCDDATTHSYVPETYVNGSQMGVGIMLVGVWKAPVLLMQPGDISGMGLGIFFIFPNQ